MKKLRLVILLSIVSLIFLSKSFAEYLVPDPELHGKFRVFPYKKEAPVVVAIKDPFCEFCNIALKEIEQVKELNVYVFWASIIHPKSKSKVNRILKCEKPSSMQVLGQVSQLQPISCKSSDSASRNEANQTFIDSYKPTAVPLYYINGKSVSFDYLKELSKEQNDLTNSEFDVFGIDWIRYQAFRVGPIKKQLPNIGIVLPNSYPFNEFPIRWLDVDSHNVFVFWKSRGEGISSKSICEEYSENCDGDYSSDYKTLLEFYELANLVPISNPIIFLESQRLSPAEYTNLLPKGLATLF